MAKRRVASGEAARVALRERVAQIAEAMEQPLRRARGLADVLAWVGYGLESIDDDGARPVLTIAVALTDDLDRLAANWDAICRAGQA
ncbi:MAG TPA: hypothetical protein VHU87_09985 [Rhizomicrobium sp.]|jgi:hypothetical protein|nr:hypothetical protein [Rhizomicrobium sp.]